MDIVQPTSAISQRHSRRSSAWLQYCLLLVLAGGVCAFGAVQPWSRFGLEVGALLLAILAIARWTFFNSEFIYSPVYLPIAGVLVIAVAQLLSHRTASAYDTRSEAMLWLTYLCCAITAANAVRRERNLVGLAIAISIFGAFLAIFAVVQSFIRPGTLYGVIIPRYPNGVYGPYVSHTHYAGLMEMLVPFPLMLAATRRYAGPRRIYLIFAGLLMAASVVASGSRGGVIVIAAELFVAFLFDSRRSVRARVVTASAIFAAVAIASVLFVTTSALDHLRYAVQHPGSDLSIETRVTVYRDALHMIPAHPWLGWGLGSFPTVFPTYRTRYDGTFMNAAHNDYLQLLVETGVLGLGMLVWLIVIVYRSGLRWAPDWKERPAAAVSIAGLIGITGLAIHCLFDFNLQIPANAAVFFVLCTVACTLEAIEKRRSRVSSRTRPHEVPGHSRAIAALDA